MKRIERAPDDEETLRLTQDNLSARMRVAMPGIVSSVNLIAQTCTIQPAIMESVPLQDGGRQTVALPLLLDVPIVYMSGGGISATFPLAAGDEVLVVFGDRCMDAWWQQGGVQPQAEFRMHNLSDGYCIPGIRSQPRRLVNVSPTSAQLRTDDGTAYIELTQTKAVNIVAPGGFNVTAPVAITGTVATTGNISSTGTVMNNGKNIGSTHQNSGVQVGTGNSGPVV